MSAIPPNWLGSIVQTQGAHARAAADQSKESAASAERTAASFAERLTQEIEATDRDSQVYSDAEGTGSQGRPFESGPEEETGGNAADETGDSDAGLDLQA